MTGRVFTAKDITDDRHVDCDVCIIGSGAGGGTVAANLVAAGKSVVMLEAGPYFTRKEFALHEEAAFQNLYQERGTRATDDQAITIMQGRNVGGNHGGLTSCFRVPEKCWQHGVTDLVCPN